MWEIMCFFNLKPCKHIALHHIHKIMLFLASSYDPFKKTCKKWSVGGSRTKIGNYSARVGVSNPAPGASLYPAEFISNLKQNQLLKVFGITVNFQTNVLEKVWAQLFKTLAFQAQNNLLMNYWSRTYPTQSRPFSASSS